MDFQKETLSKNLELTVANNKQWWEWDLWLNRGTGFAVYLMAFGKAETKEEALEFGRNHARKIARKQ